MLDSEAGRPVVDGVPDADPELVVVFEVVESTVDLGEAMRSAGLELLVEAEADFDDGELGEDFARLSSRSSEPIHRYLHASMANRQAVSEILRLWRHWKTGARMIRGFGPFTALFSQLHDVRAWSAADRVRSTGLDLLIAAGVADGLDDVPVNIELWYRADHAKRRSAERAVGKIVETSGGEVLRAVTIEEIGFHAMAASVPTSALAAIASDLDQVALLRSPDVLFVRPGGQRAEVSLDADLATVDPVEDDDAHLPPILALLDGMPSVNHPLLRNRLVIHDPDDFGSDPTYTVDLRRHGTMVASAAVWGDLSAGEPATPRRVLVRPVMKPDTKTRDHAESIPWDELPADLMVRAVREILGSRATPGVMPSVKVVNISLGDPMAQFDTVPSAWARALDWLSYEYNVLFIVSAGNHIGPLNYGITGDELKLLSADDLDRVTAEVLAAGSPSRRLLSPAESLNSITVGALHSDAAGDTFPLGYRFDLWGTAGHPSPVTAHGRGIRRAVKPDVAIAGGRKLYDELHGQAAGSFAPARGTTFPPGIKVAAPPDRVAFTAGTTFAAVEVARRAARIIDSLSHSEQQINERFAAVAAKALIVHGAVRPSGQSYVVPSDRLVGNGMLQRDLAIGCLPTQATLLATADIGSRECVEIVIPFPRGLAASTDIRRISMTLAWISPINWNHRQYRRAKLTIEGPSEIPSGPNVRTNVGTSFALSQRGTVEHRVFETSSALSSDRLTFKVTCSAQAGGFLGVVPFALAVSLEVGAHVNLDVYELVRQELRIRQRVVP